MCDQSNESKTPLYKDPYLIRCGKRLTGDDITMWHTEHRSASYHCINCGAEISHNKYPCYVCGWDD